MFVFFYLLDLESFKKIFHVLYRSKAKNGVIYGFPQIIYTNYILMVLSYIKIKVISFCEIKASLIRKINQEGGELGFWKTFLITTNLIIIRHKYKKIELERANANFIVVRHPLPTSTLLKLQSIEGSTILETSTKLPMSLHLDFGSNGHLHNPFKNLPTRSCQCSQNSHKQQGSKLST